jgi:excinuclease ABC subunit A
MIEQIPAVNAVEKIVRPAPPTANDHIVIRGARTHNLKSIDVDIPHNALTVVSGVSGSGKSSLAFDTVYAEGQRRYVESLSAYARQFLERIEKPDVDHMDGLAPAIAIKQKNQTRNPRSTVATATEIYDYLRLLYARCGTVTCLHCGGIVRHDTVDEIVAALIAMGGREDKPATRAYALFPILRAELKFEPLQPATTELPPEPPKPVKAAKKSASNKSMSSVVDFSSLTDTLKDRLTELRRRGYNRLYQQIPGEIGKGAASQGKIVEFSTPESLLELDFSQPIFVLIDRLAISPDIRTRIVDAIETGYREAGEVQFHTVPREEEAPQHLRFSAAFECSTCHRAYREPEPRLFSFNNPYGACPRCQGFGNTIDFDPNLILPDRSKTLAQGAIAPWTTPKYRPFHGEMVRFAKSAAIPTDVPYYDLSPAQQELLWDGPERGKSGGGAYPGIRGFFAALERKKYKLHVRVFLSKYRGYALCPDCRGQRLRAEARAVLINNQNICEVSALTITAAQAFFDNLQLSPSQIEIAGKILEEVRQRIHFLQEVGLDYLTLDRLSSTLSGGESQRIQLATSLGSRLVGALYVLDEPSIGLHTRDTAKLIRIMHSLRDLGNTILVVEHDPDVIRSADYLLDLGPGAGELGGQLLAAGTVAEVTANPRSITGKYLSGRLTIPIPKHRREPGREHLRLTGARIHNLRGVDIDIPLNLLCCVTGVSGSGKSTLIHQVLYRALMQALNREPGASEPEPTHLYRALSGTQHLNDVILVDQSPIGRTPRSNPVTYIKAFDEVRALFAAQPDSKRKGFTAGSFSFNVPGGRCDVCEGDGTVTVEMQFLADIELPCEECNGTRYKSSILDIKYKGRNIHDVLNMTVKEALVYFAGNPRIVDKLYVLDEVGLGYVRLGQSATTLSGGEAQRVKLASHLATARSISNRNGDSTIMVTSRANNYVTAERTTARARSRTLYILDEPTTGLHFDDVQKLLAAFRKLIEGGGSLLVIEHNLDVIKSADWVIDMGPEGGSAGGEIVATGTPEAIAANPASHTGHYLAPVLHLTPAL